MADFKDYFSKTAAGYAVYRPRYPDGLFAYLAGLAPQRETAWDCATGNGQAAVALATHFDRVWATDASEQQIQRAVTHPKICYAVARAEASGLPPGSVDLITVAQAAHWFDRRTFYLEAKRVARPEGVLVLWCYGLLRVSRAIDAIIDPLYGQVLDAYWPAERRHVEHAYRVLEFPFLELASPEFEMHETWNITQTLGYLNTWSAATRYKEANGLHPLEDVSAELARAWGDGLRPVRWPLSLRVGRIGTQDHL